MCLPRETTRIFAEIVVTVFGCSWRTLDKGEKLEIWCFSLCEESFVDNCDTKQILELTNMNQVVSHFNSQSSPSSYKQ